MMNYEKPPERRANTVRIITVGDSITQGYLYNNGTFEIYSNRSFPIRLAEMINNEDSSNLLVHYANI